MSFAGPRPSKNIVFLLLKTAYLLASQSIARALNRCGDKFRVHALSGESAEAFPGRTIQTRRDPD